jgi:hypothetical protein
MARLFSWLADPSAGGVKRVSRSGQALVLSDPVLSRSFGGEPEHGLARSVR